ncbi:MAG: 50S ribosomal protein L9 [Halofilum sp. (in: g-proteobacteria)]|nr:50S ribosomal protein L9 [Halofilum sp. (in: g-proteobacteria)]
MQVILVENVDNLGKLGDVVQVKSGYARNFLLPKGVARMATPENIKAIEAQRAELEREEAARAEAAEQRYEALNGHRVTIQAKVGPEERLFGSVSAGDIVDALAADGLEAEKREIRLPEGPLRTVGEFEIDVHLHGDLNATITVVIEPEE